MTAPLVTLTEIKTYLGKTGTDDDVLIASIASNASAMAQQDTGRTFAVSSNVTETLSTDGQSTVGMFNDRPMADATRVVTLYGATLTENTNYWLLPDRRNPEIAVTIQIRPFNRLREGWYKVDPQWWDKNLDNPKWGAGSGLPNDLSISGTVGHPTLPGDVKMAVLELAAYLYWRAKGGASSYAETLQGTDVDLSALPEAYQLMVKNWRIRTQVASV